MEKPVVLRGYQYSVYNRIARVALHEKSVEYHIEDIDPFEASVPADYVQRHPFRRVPVLSHGDFDIYETAAITRYIDAAFDGPSLIPVEQEAVARVAQVVSIVDSYGYRPMIRQVFSHRVFRPAVDVDSDETEVEQGVEASRTVLAALNALAAEGLVLNGRTFTLADCHLAPMVAYFVQAAEGAEALGDYTALSDWWAAIAQRKSVLETVPGLPSRGGIA
jgi:glutathione S-transferase